MGIISEILAVRIWKDTLLNEVVQPLSHKPVTGDVIFANTWGKISLLMKQTQWKREGKKRDIFLMILHTELAPLDLLSGTFSITLIPSFFFFFSFHCSFLLFVSAEAHLR